MVGTCKCLTLALVSTVVKGEELQRRLDGRSYAWLAAYLGVSRYLVRLWALDMRRISPERCERIRARLPLPGEVDRRGDGDAGASGS